MIRDPRWRAALLQLAVVAAVVALGAYLVHNTLVNLARAGIATGFGYLGREAGFDIGESLIAYGPQDSYGRALEVGLLNTLLVASLGVVLSTILGTAIGIARLAQNWLLQARRSGMSRRCATCRCCCSSSCGGTCCGSARRRRARRGSRCRASSSRSAASSFRCRTGRPPIAMSASRSPPHWSVAAIILWRTRRGGLAVALAAGAPLAAFLAEGAPWHWNWPSLAAFNFTGGASLSPEFAALLFGLTAYTAAFIAEIVRSGILGVSRGQSEAAQALGLRRGQTLRLVILPQALRIIVPPLLSEYLALTKNSSLAIAVGFPELMSITNTTLNQTGQAVEAIALMMAIYLAISLATSLAMNLYNRRVATAHG